MCRARGGRCHEPLSKARGSSPPTGQVAAPGRASLLAPPQHGREGGAAAGLDCAVQQRQPVVARQLQDWRGKDTQ